MKDENSKFENIIGEGIDTTVEELKEERERNQKKLWGMKRKSLKKR